MDSEKLRFDVLEMINAFSFDNFFKKKKLGEPNSGYLLITNSQYILGYNRAFGKGSHSEAFVNAFLTVREIDRKLTFEDVLDLDDEISRDYINAQFVNEEKYGTYILFNLTYINSITSSQYALFEKFYNEYNSLIYELSKMRNEPMINLVLPGLVSRKEIDLTYLLNYFKTIVDDEKYLPNDSLIIGEKIGNKKKG